MSAANKALIKKYVRDVCSLAKGYGVTEEFMHDAISSLVPAGVEMDEMREAVEWNVSQGFVKRTYNDDTEAHEWSITKAGIAKDNV